MYSKDHNDFEEFDDNENVNIKSANENINSSYHTHSNSNNNFSSIKVKKHKTGNDDYMQIKKIYLEYDISITEFIKDYKSNCYEFLICETSKSHKRFIYGLLIMFASITYAIIFHLKKNKEYYIGKKLFLYLFIFCLLCSSICLIEMFIKLHTFIKQIYLLECGTKIKIIDYLGLKYKANISDFSIIYKEDNYFAPKIYDKISYDGQIFRINKNYLILGKGYLIYNRKVFNKVCNSKSILIDKTNKLI